MANPQPTIEKNERSIVFFDGVCGLCNHTVDFLMARDSNARLSFAPLQGKTAEELLPEKLRKDLNTFVFITKGHQYIRSAAMVRILITIGGFWRLVGALLWLIPLPLRDVCYRIVSRIRFRLFGKKESCRLPTPEERSRFLE